jgi:hypothetical protein
MKKLAFVSVLVVGVLSGCGSVAGPGGVPVNTPRAPYPPRWWAAGMRERLDHRLL